MKWLLLIFSLVASFATSICVGPSATGSGSGVDWNNLKAWTGTPVRGDTWYLADGAYAGKTLSVAVSGTTLITIKKATISDHGPTTGWLDTMGDGQATFTGGNLAITTSYWTINGQSGSGDGRTVPYGIYILTGQGSSALDIEGTTGTHTSNITVSYVEAAGITNLGDFTYTSGTKPLYFGFTDNCTVFNCSIHGGETLIDFESGFTTPTASTGTIISNCVLYASRSIADAFHANVAYVTACSNGTFANNAIYNYNAEGFFVTGFDASVSTWKIYGNTFYSTGAGEALPRAIELRQDFSYDHIVAINNTFVNVDGYLDRTAETGNTCAGCSATNNLGYASSNEQGNSAFSNNTVDNVNRFVNLAGFDFRLTSSLAGVSLSTPYNVDKLGNTRGADGTWDIGAFEFGSGGGTTGGAGYSAILSGSFSVGGSAVLR